MASGFSSAWLAVGAPSQTRPGIYARPGTFCTPGLDPGPAADVEMPTLPCEPAGCYTDAPASTQREAEYDGCLEVGPQLCPKPLSFIHVFRVGISLVSLGRHPMLEAGDLKLAIPSRRESSYKNVELVCRIPIGFLWVNNKSDLPQDLQ